MTYNPAIPQPTDNLSVSQGDLLTNFGQLNTLYGLDHVTFNNGTSANRGLHQKVTLVNVQADPSAISFPYSVIYSKTFGTSANRNLELYYAEERETSGQLVNLIPTVKAYGRVLFTTPGNYTLITTNSLVVNTPVIMYVNNQVFTVQFANALDYDTYSVFFTNTSATSDPSIVARSIAVGGFTVVLSTGISNNGVVTFMVI